MSGTIKVLAVGDVVGRPGRRAVARVLPELRRELQIDLVVANGENASGGFGLTRNGAQELMSAGVDVFTSGNHIWDQREALDLLDSAPVLRPFNYPEGVPGRGWMTVDLGEKGEVAICNLQGVVFMPPLDSAFRAAERFLAEAGAVTIKLVDLHAEATSEKMAMGHFLDGRISMLWGTHTHVPTADQHVMPKGTGFVSDLGMVGPRDSVIGMDPDGSLQRMLTGIPQRFKVGSGVVTFNSVLVTISAADGRAEDIRRVDRLVQDSSVE